MFYDKDFKQIDKEYFNIIRLSEFAITIQSKNTHHYWHITHNVPRGFIIQHRYEEFGSYHKQCSAKKLSTAFAKIKHHDNYILKKQKLSC